mmetsp:Transcript_7372/g.21944  ORF Transcript_7372/g.21944 Transcript_7372/m.21944 type:complete len:275 (-) Transcript_7372:117-941(-)
MRNSRTARMRRQRRTARRATAALSRASTRQRRAAQPTRVTTAAATSRPIRSRRRSAAAPSCTSWRHESSHEGRRARWAASIRCASAVRVGSLAAAAAAATATVASHRLTGCGCVRAASPTARRRPSRPSGWSALPSAGRSGSSPRARPSRCARTRTTRASTRAGASHASWGAYTGTARLRVTMAPSRCTGATTWTYRRPIASATASSMSTFSTRRLASHSAMSSIADGCACRPSPALIGAPLSATASRCGSPTSGGRQTTSPTARRATARARAA